MRSPRLTRFGLHLGEAHARWGIGNANQYLARRADDLPSGELCLALQGLVAVGAVEFEFVCVHSLYPHKRISGRESMFLFWHILFGFKLRLLW